MRGIRSPLTPGPHGRRKDNTLPSALSSAPRHHKLLRTLGLAALPVALAGLLAGCGSSHSSGTAADPATAIPASAPLYAGADVRPGGAEKTAALAAGRALTHQADPYLRLLGVLQTPGSPRLSFKQDVAPWLGPHAGVYLTSLGSASSLTAMLQQGLLGGSSSTGIFPFGTSRAKGAIVLDTSDVAKARSFLDTQAKRAGAHATSYRGVSVQSASSGATFALVDRFAVVGSESGVHGVIDTTLGAASLARASGYAKLLAAAPAGALAHVYSNPTGASASGATGASGTGERLYGLLALLTGTREANVSLTASTGSLALDADTISAGSPGAAGGLLSTDAEATKALGELPGESWLAVGLGHLGSTLAQDVQGLRTLSAFGSTITGTGSDGPPSSTTINVKSLLGAMLAPLNALGASSAQAKRDFASWMGSAGIFASGGSLLELKAAIVIASKSPALSRAAVNKLAAQLHKAGGSLRPVAIAGTDAAVGVAISGLPVVLDIADGRGSSGQTKFVLGFGEASVEAALNPPSTLAAAAPRAAAVSTLGEGIQPSLMLDFPTLLSLLEGVGLTEDPSISKFIPYLRSATTLSGGGRDLGGGAQRFRLVLGL